MNKNLTVSITKENSKPVAKDMFGLFFEDINYGLDGGLHAEMLENRNFEAVLAMGDKDDYRAIYDGGYGWSVYETESYGSSLRYHGKQPLNDVNPHYLVFTGRGPKPAFTNKAYDGIYLKKDMKYTVSFYARPIEGQAEVTVSVVKYGETLAEASVNLDRDGEAAEFAVTAQETEPADVNTQLEQDESSGNRAGSVWKKYTVTLQAQKDADHADFVVSLSEEGTIAFDQFSMIPEDAVLGIFRRDLVELLQGLKPGFIRFPGGCIVEGNGLANRYQWKLTLGRPEERKFNWNRWAVHNNSSDFGFSGSYAHYGQTYGVGYYEYFLLCEYLGAKPLPVMNVGIGCQFMCHEWVETDSPEMQQYIQDALDLIAFANEPADGKWGAVRAAMGHPEPFGLEYLGIGNEQWQTEQVDFFTRYEMFEQAIHDVYPDIKLIGSAGPDVKSEHYRDAWNWIRPAAAVKKNFVYAVDEHYYVRPKWMYDNLHFYDHYDRSVKVFSGEYAAHVPGAGGMNQPQTNNWEAGLAEAAFLTGVERNADVVVLASYAPLFARLGYAQWSPNLIWFNGKSAYGTPSYYVQQAYSLYRGTRTLHADTGLDAAAEAQEKVYCSVTASDDGSVLYVKLVNAGDTEKAVTLTGTDFSVSDYRCIKTVDLKADPAVYNRIGAPETLVPEITEGPETVGEVKLPAYSFRVLVFKSSKWG